MRLYAHDRDLGVLLRLDLSWKPNTVECAGGLRRKCLLQPAFSGGGGCGTETCAAAPESFFAVETTAVDCAVQDPSGNTGKGSGSVRVNDALAPVLTYPANLDVRLPPGAFGTNVTFPTPGVVDNCPGVGPASCVFPSGWVVPVGTTVVTCSASDASSNSGSCSLSLDVTALSIEAIPAASAWHPEPGRHRPYVPRIQKPEEERPDRTLERQPLRGLYRPIRGQTLHRL